MAVLAAGVTVAMVPLAPAIVEFLLGPPFAAAGRTAGFLLVAAAFCMLAASGRGVAGGYGERVAFVLGLIALAAVAAAVYAWRIPASKDVPGDSWRSQRIGHPGNTSVPE